MSNALWGALFGLGAGAIAGMAYGDSGAAVIAASGAIAGAIVGATGAIVEAIQDANSRKGN